jgi:hypothetical protein
MRVKGLLGGSVVSRVVIRNDFFTPNEVARCQSVDCENVICERKSNKGRMKIILIVEVYFIEFLQLKF